jgi:hypothetical protein
MTGALRVTLVRAKNREVGKVWNFCDQNAGRNMTVTPILMRA